MEAHDQQGLQRKVNERYAPFGALPISSNSSCLSQEEFLCSECLNIMSVSIIHLSMLIQ